jgi:hypothetical protein
VVSFIVQAMGLLLLPSVVLVSPRLDRRPHSKVRMRLRVFATGAEQPHTVAGVPIVCFPIWHWYMFRGDWLKSENGVKLATSESKLLVSSSS